MQHFAAIRQLANRHLTQYNQLVRTGQARSLELQTECALEVLAELADQLGGHDIYQQITNRLHQLESCRVLAPITARGGEA